MRIVFMGTQEFVIPTLLEISRSGHVPVAVYARAPAQRGRRGLELRKAKVHLTADSIGRDIAQTVFPRATWST